MLSIVCWKWKPLYGVPTTKTRTPFTAEDVNQLYVMLKTYLHLDFQLLCVTDDPKGINPAIKIIPLWNDFRKMGGCFTRLKAFSKDIGKLFGPRFVSIDLDCVIVNDITPLFNRDDDFIIWGNHGGRTQYCGSLFMMNSGCRSQVYETFDPKRYAVFHGRYKNGTDQNHISKILHDEKMWTSEDGIYAYRSPKRTDLPANARIIFFNGFPHPKDADTQSSYPWLSKYYPSNAKNIDDGRLNVVSFYWKGKEGSGWDNPALGAIYVNRLYRSIRENLTIPFRFICFVQTGITLPELDRGIEVRYFKSPSWLGRLPKLYAHSPDNGLAGRVVIVDLDLIVTGNLDEIFSYSGKFMTRGEPRTFNISGGDIIFFKAGSFDFWRKFCNDPTTFENRTKGRERLFYRMEFGNHMDFLQLLFPTAFQSFKVHLRRQNIPLPKGTKLVSFHGHPKPHEVVNQITWMREYWHD